MQVTEIYTRVTGAKAIAFVPRGALLRKPKFVPPPVDEYDSSSSEDDELDAWVAPPLPPSSPFIAILDIFGFEVLRTNGYVAHLVFECVKSLVFACMLHEIWVRFGQVAAPAPPESGGQGSEHASQERLRSGLSMC